MTCRNGLIGWLKANFTLSIPFQPLLNVTLSVCVWLERRRLSHASPTGAKAQLWDQVWPDCPMTCSKQ